MDTKKHLLHRYTKNINYTPMKTYNKTKQLINLLFILAVSFYGCKQKPFDPKVSEQAEEKQTLVELTPEQAKNAQITLGSLQNKIIGEQIQVSGIMDVPPQGLISINAPYGGFIKKTDLLAGSHVHKGDLMVEIVHPDYIQLQQDYLDSKSQLEIATKELERQNALYKEQVASDKVVQQAESDYKIIKNKVNALEEKLLLIGFTPKQIKANGISGSVSIYAPISGYIKTVNINIGKYVTPTDMMFELVDTEHLHAELNVFEKDIAKVQPGQKIIFTLPNDNEKERTASVYLLGKSINSDRTISIHGHLDKEDNTLLPGMYIKGFIETQRKDALTLPDEAFVNAEGKTYVFMAKGHNKYEKLEVSKGSTEKGFTEAVFKVKMDTDNTKFAVSGAYTLLAKMLNKSEE